MFYLFCIYFDVLSVLIGLLFLIAGDWTMVGSTMKIVALYGKFKAVASGSALGKGQGRGQGRGGGKGKGKDKGARPPSPVAPSSSSEEEVPSAHASGDEEEVPSAHASSDEEEV